MNSEKTIFARLFSGGAWAFGGKIITSFSGLMASAILARLLSLQEMGVYFLAISMVGVASLIAQFGLHQTVLGMTSQALGKGLPERAAAIVTKVLILAMFGAVFVAAAVYLGLGQWVAMAILKSPATAGVISIVAFWVVVQSLQSVIAEAFRGYHDIRLATAVGGGISSVLFVSLLGAALLGKFGLNLKAALSLTVISAAIGVTVGAAFLARRLSIRPYADVRWREILTTAWPLFLSNIAFVLTQADLWILGAFRPDDEVGLYGAAARLVTLVSVPLLLVNAVVPPMLGELYAKGDHVKLQRVLRTTATLAGVPSLVVLIAFAVLGEPILGAVYGEMYRAAGLILVLLSIGQLVNVWSGSCGFMLIMSGRERIQMWILVPCGVVTITLCLVLVRSYGATGVAIASMSGAILQNILMWLAVRHSLGVWTHVSFREFWKQTQRFAQMCATRL